MTKRGILRKIFITFAVPVIVIFIVAQILILLFIKNPIEDVTKKQIEAQTSSISYQVSEYFTKYIEIVEQMASNLAYDNMFKEIKTGMNIRESIYFEQNMESLIRVGKSGESIHTAWLADMDTSILIQSNGEITETGWDITERPFYQQILHTKDVILTEPYQDAKTQNWTISIIKPIYPEGESSPIGVDCLDIEIGQLMQIMSSYSLGKSGFFSLISKDGQIMNYPQEEYINKNITETKLSKNLIESIQQGNSNLLEYTDNGKRYVGYVKEVGKTGWNIISGLPILEYKETYTKISTITFVIFIVCSLILILAVVFVARNISKPIKVLANAAQRIANGEMSVEEMPVRNDEIGLVSSAFDKTVLRLKQYMQYIQEIKETLNKIADGKLNYTLQYDYSGEFAQIKEAFIHISNSLNDTMGQINTMAGEVAATSAVVAESAKDLSNGAEEQKVFMGAISEQIIQVENKMQEDAEHAKEASNTVIQLGNDMKKSNQQVDKMIEAMHQIKSASYEIESMVGMIQDISTQTNLLSLNASIEAARAGEAGRGFAVVADQIGKLAADSANSAIETKNLIDKSLSEIENGNVITKKTVEDLESIIKRISAFAEMAKGSSEASESQVEMLNQIQFGIEQFASVIQNNSAAAQESSAVSEELSAQSENLKVLVEQFQFKD